MKISILAKYVFTPFASFLSIVFTVFIWIVINPYLFLFIMELRGDGFIWDLFGRWGILIIWTIINILLLSIFGLFGMLMGKLVQKLSPNNTFTLYSYVVCSIIVLIYFIYQFWIDAELGFYEIIQFVIFIAFIIILCMITGNAAVED